MTRRRPEPAVGPTNAETLALKRDFEPRTIVEFRDRNEQQRTGLVVGAERGLLVVRSPAAVARMPKKTWGVTEPYPRKHRVPRARVVSILRRPRRRSVEEE